MNVLIANDNRGTLHLLSGFFKYMGFEVTTVANGEEALERFDECSSWSLVVTDVQMDPGPSGLAVLQKIRSSHPDLPVLVISGEGGYAKPAVELGAGFLQKPFSLDDLRGLVEELVEEGKPGATRFANVLCPVRPADGVVSFGEAKGSR